MIIFIPPNEHWVSPISVGVDCFCGRLLVVSPIIISSHPIRDRRQMLLIAVRLLLPVLVLAR
jgi:hypothetical protein